MLARAIERGWITGPRFDVHKPRKQLVAEIRQRGDYTLAERAVLGAFALLDRKDDRPKGIGTRCVVAMERINQADDIARLNADPFNGELPQVAAEQAITNNTQINFYLPDNGRGPVVPANHEHNGHAG